MRMVEVDRITFDQSIRVRQAPQHADLLGLLNAMERTQVENFIVKKVAVLGAGVMGAQIAAHLVNAKVPVVLFDLPAKEGPKNGIVLKAIDNLKKLNPAPLGNKDDAQYIEVANY